MQGAEDSGYGNVDGVDAAGKGTMINRVIQFLDPRGCLVLQPEKPERKRKCAHILAVFATKLLEKEGMATHLTKAGIVGVRRRNWGKRCHRV